MSLAALLQPPGEPHCECLRPVMTATHCLRCGRPLAPLTPAQDAALLEAMCQVVSEDETRQRTHRLRGRKRRLDPWRA